MTDDGRRDELVADVVLVLGVAAVGVGVALLSLAAAFVVVGGLLLALVTVPRLLAARRPPDAHP